MNAPSVDIKEILEAYGESSGLGLYYANNLFIGKEPDKPDNCVTIFDTTGYPPYIGLTDVGYEYPSVQIRVRNKKQEDGWNQIEEIKDVLHGFHQTIVNGTLYSLITCSSGPALLDWDDKERVRFIINFNLQRRVA